jgi:GntR family transcriptional regulator
VDAPEIDYRAELPPHRQIAGWLCERIEAGELNEGEPVPSEKELMDAFGVARTTVRRAVAYLRDQAVIKTVPGWGSYVAQRKPRRLCAGLPFTGDVRCRPVTASVGVTWLAEDPPLASGLVRPL